jgi:hypothetical protein
MPRYTRNSTIALIAVIALVIAILALVFSSNRARANADETPCVPSDAWSETVFDHWQRYSWTGGPHEQQDPPAFPSSDWQPNVQGDPHGIGVAGAYFVSHGNSGRGDWFYLEAVNITVDHPAVICEEDPTDPTPTDPTDPTEPTPTDPTEPTPTDPTDPPCMDCEPCLKLHIAVCDDPEGPKEFDPKDPFKDEPRDEPRPQDEPKVEFRSICISETEIKVTTYEDRVQVAADFYPATAQDKCATGNPLVYPGEEGL